MSDNKNKKKLVEITFWKHLTNFNNKFLCQLNYEIGFSKYISLKTQS
jgi:hypothetical protein